MAMGGGWGSWRTRRRGSGWLADPAAAEPSPPTPLPAPEKPTDRARGAAALASSPRGLPSGIADRRPVRSGRAGVPRKQTARGGLEVPILGGRPARPAAGRAAWEAKPLAVWLPSPRGKRNPWRFGFPADVGGETPEGLASRLAWEAKAL